MPDIQLYFAPAFFLRHGFDSSKTDGFTIAPTLVYVKSRGYVKSKSAHALAYPEIQPNYFSDEDDLNALVEGIRLVRKIASQPAFDAYRGEEFTPSRRAD